MKATSVLILSLALAGLVAAAAAQQPAFLQPTFKRTVIQRGDLSIPGREVVTAIAEFQPHATVGRHTHPGEEAGYILEGTLLLEQDGKPAVTLGVGQTFLIPAGGVHNATATGASLARVLATYVVEKDKPLATQITGK